MESIRGAVLLGGEGMALLAEQYRQAKGEIEDVLSEYYRRGEDGNYGVLAVSLSVKPDWLL